MNYFIYWTAAVKSSKLWSSQLWTQFILHIEAAWKIQDFNGVWTGILGFEHIQPEFHHSLLDFTSTIQYMKYFIYHFTFIPHRVIRTHKWPAPNISGFIAQLVRALHQYHKVTGSKWNPVEVLNFSSFYTQLHTLHSYLRGS